MRGRLLRSLTAVGVLATALVACDSPRPSPSGLSPAPSVSFPVPLPSETVAVPPATHLWKPDNLSCPTLRGAGAKVAGLLGAGKRVRGTDTHGGNTLECRWGPQDETAASATVQIDTATTQAAADTAWKVLAGPYRTPLPGVGEQAFVSPDIGDNRLNVVVHSGNAILNVTLIARRGDAGGAQVLRDSAADIAADMLGALVPA